jgi:hypothetical protein
MKKFIKNLMGLTVSLVMAGALSPVLADTAAPAATAAPTAAATPAPPTVTVNGMVDTYYQYNFSDGNNGGTSSGYYYNGVDNSFTLGLAEAKFTATQGAASGHLVLAYGQEASSAAGGLGTTGLGFDVLQAYVAYNPGQWTFTGGRFVTWMGNEVVESNANWNYSHSLLFGVIPIWHTGLSVNFAPSSTFNVTGYAVDGNNVVSAAGMNGKTYGLEAVLAPSSQWSFTLNGLEGPIAGQSIAPNGGSNFIGEGIIKFTPDSMLSFALDAQYGMTSYPATTPASPTPSYFGLALYGRDQIASDWAVALRLEDLMDNGELNIAPLNTAGTAYNTSSLYEGTLTIEHDFTANLLGRLEGRFDTNATATAASTSTTAAYDYASGSANSQVTATYSMVFTY